MTTLNAQDMEAYFITLLWSSTDDNGSPLDDNYDSDDIDQSSKDKSLEYCQDFINLVESQPSPDPDYDNLLELALEFARAVDFHSMGSILHDFWLTRNGHGAGFWDGDYCDRNSGIDIGGKLTELAKTFGSVDAYVGDDGKVYLTE